MTTQRTHWHALYLSALVASVIVICGSALARAGYVGAPFPVSDDTTQVLPENQPRAVYGADRFLVVHTQWVYDEFQQVHGDIAAAFYDPQTGTTNRFALDTFDSSSVNPAVAYDPDNDRYLVAYEDWRDGFSDSDLYVRLLDNTGETLAERFLASTYNDELTPDVAYISNGKFIVVWCDTTNPNLPVDAIVMGRTVSYGMPDLLLGTEYILNANTSYIGLTHPKVAVNKFDTCMVVWQWPFSTAGTSMNDWEHDIQARVLNGNGQPIGPVQSLAGTRDNETMPSLSYDPYDDVFFVAWQDMTAYGDHDILAALATIDASNQVATSLALTIAGGTNDDTQPAAAWNSGLHQFEVLWETEYTATDHDIYACAVSPTGTVGPEYAVVKSVDMESRPALARGDGAFLAVYEDESFGAWPAEVYGSLIFDVAPPPHVLSVYPSLVTVQPFDDGMSSVLISFDQAVQISQADVTVQGLMTGARNDFTLSYDAQDHIAVLSWAAPLPDDTYLVTVRDSVANDGGIHLDGNMDLALPVLPSGDGLEGGDFQGLVYRLVADTNGDLSVDVVDLLTLAGSWGQVQGDPGYNPTADLNSDDAVDVIDLLTLAEHWGESIPALP